ncbi:MAG TPA: protein kinase [Candidatus Limnocylindria bacterium]|nr:protein kinase [Candidatus Limnocylindria bacterium]
MPAPGDRLAARYELIAPIGSGGMASVWRARDLRLGRQVAVKLLRPQYAEDEEFVLRFEVEARHAASLAHPNVAPVYDTDVDGDQRFIVMELVDGPTVADVIVERGRIEPVVAVGIAAAAARALAAAHRRGLIHRDVKPANLLLGRDGRARLADFGIARALTSSRVTTPGTVLGSIPYLSPEQARGEEATAAGDVFSLGVVLFEMLTGSLPWQAETPAGMATVRVTEPAPPPSELVGALPQGLDRIVGRALEVQPGNRFPSATVFADALESWLRKQGTSVRGKARIRRATTALATAVSPTAGADPAVAIGTHAASRLVARANPNPCAMLPSGRGATRAGRLARELPRAGGRRLPAPPEVVPRSSDVDRRSGAVIVAIAFMLLGGVVAGFLVGGGAASPSAAPGAAVAPTLTPEPTTLATAPSVPAVRPTVLTLSTVTPSKTPEPTPSPTPEPTPRPTSPPTPRPTPRPTEAVPQISAPARAVVAFYDAVERHDWDTATALWSASMQERYPPEEWLIDRFRRTTRMDITRLVTVSQGDGRARVEVSLTEYRTVEPSPRRFAGAWDLVHVDGRWLLDDPDF